MTLEQAMAKLALTFYGTFSVVFLLGIALGVVATLLIRGPRRAKAPAQDGLMSVAYSVGVASPVHPFGERCQHRVQFLDECQDCPDGCPQVVA